MNSLLYYYNNVQKMAAYRQAKRMQRGVKLGHEQPIMSASTTKFVSAPISIGISDFAIEFYGNTYGSYTNSNPSLYNQTQPYTYGEGFLSVYQVESEVGGIEWIIFEKPATGAELADSINLRYKPIDPIEKFYLVITRQGTTVKVYINGELEATKEQSEVKGLGDLQLAIANSSDVGFVRVWNYALSADDVTAHYNNGDPMGYVVPKAEKGIDYSVELTGTKSYTWNAENTSYMVIVPAFPMYLGGMYKVNITISNYEAGSPFIFEPIYKVPSQNGTYDIVVKNISVIVNRLYIYGGLINTDRRLTLTVNSVTPVGLLAEYLPQNLMASRKGPAVEPVTEIFEFNVGDPYYVPAIYTKSYPFDCIYRVDYVVDEWDFQPKVYSQAGFGPIGGASIVSGVQTWPTESAAKVGEVQSVFVKMSGTQPSALYLYGGNDNEEATARHLKVTIVGITPVSVPISWLDSAKQMPLSDEYMEPLFQSIGGYDMTANGAPEILYNE